MPGPEPYKRTVAERFQSAADAADEISGHPLIRTKSEIGISLTGGGGVMAMQLRLPDEERFGSLLLRMRPFLLENEDAYLPRIMNLGTQHIDDGELVHAIESGQRAYRRVRRKGLGELRVGGELVTPHDAAVLWLNAAYYHRDADKERYLRSMDEPPRALIRHSFALYVMEVAMVAVWTGSVLREAEKRGVIREDPVIPATAHPIDTPSD